MPKAVKPKPTLKIERVKLSSLVENPHNPVTHPEANLDAIRRSIKAFGQAEPLVVQKSSRRIIGGNGRCTVLKELGHDEADVVFLDVDDRTADALGMALNKTADLHDWDWGTTTAILKEISADDFDLSATGFAEDEIAAMLADEQQSPPDDSGDQPLKSLAFTAEQWEVIKLAIKTVRQGPHGGSEEDLPNGRCVELALADWLAGQ